MEPGHSSFFFVVLLTAFVQEAPASHFRGAIITWKPGNTKGGIIIEYRVSWRTSYGSQVACDDTLIKQERTVSGQGNLGCFSNCRSGIKNLGQLSYKCTDYSAIEDWSTGMGHIVQTFTSEQTPPSSVFQFGFSGGAWIDNLVTGGGNWILRVTADLELRPDKGNVNSSPTVAIPPIVRLQHGCNHTLRIPVEDPDHDDIRCRWATAAKNECGGICKTFPNAKIDARKCTIIYEAVYKTGMYAMAIQVEDFEDTQTNLPLSSVPVQFLVNVFQSSDTCTAKTEFVEPTPKDGACIVVPYGKAFESTIVARVTRITSSVSEMKTVSPLGLTKSRLYKVNATDWRMNFTFTPVPGGDISNTFCFAAKDALGSESDQRCITMLAGVATPSFIGGSPSGVVDQNQSRWTLTADSDFILSSSEAFIRLYNRTGHLLESINSSDTNSVTFHRNNRTVLFVTKTKLIQKEEYYFLLDSGIVKGTAFCGLESKAVEDPAFWKIRVRGLIPPSIVVTQTTLQETNSTEEELKWKADEPIVVTCNLTRPGGTVSQISCYNTCIDTSIANGNYTLTIHATDLDGNQATQIHSWAPGNCTFLEKACHTRNNVCLEFGGIVGTHNFSELPPQPPLIELKSGNGFSNEPIELTISAKNLSGSLKDIIIYVYGVPDGTTFTKGILLNDSTLLIQNSDFGQLNMTTQYQGELTLTARVIQHFEILNISKGGKLQMKVYPKLKEVDIKLDGCFAEDDNGSAVALINSSVVFGNRFLDFPSRSTLRVPYTILLTVPPWVQPLETPGGSTVYEIGSDVVNGMLKLIDRFEPVNMSVSVSINPVDVPSQTFSKSAELVHPCKGECRENEFGPNCNQRCSCEMKNTKRCDKYDGTCSCLPTWRGDTCNDFACACIYNNTLLCKPENQNCLCKEGWTGAACDTDINECKNSAICEKYPNTACQNRNWGYDCLCLVGYKLENNSCIEGQTTGNENIDTVGENTTITPGEVDKKTPVTIHVDIDVPETDNLKVGVTYEKYKEKTMIMLYDFYKEQLGDNFLTVIVHNISAGSLIIEHTVVTNDDVVASQDLAVTIYHMTENSETVKLVFGGHTVTVKEVFVENVKVTNLCDAYICETTECIIRFNRPTCRQLDENSTVWNPKLLSLLGLLPVNVAIAWCCRRRRNSKRNKRKNRKLAFTGEDQDNIVQENMCNC